MSYTIAGSNFFIAKPCPLLLNDVFNGAMPLEGSSYNNLTEKFIHMKTYSRWLLPFAAVVFALTVSKVKASPYASCITNNNGIIQFYLNESGGNVVVTYEDGSTNVNFDGFTAGTNLASGQYGFSMGTHTSYAIAVSKLGTGVPGLATNTIQKANGNYIFITGNPRGLAVNQNPVSPYFGHLYLARSLGNPNAGIWSFNSDGSIAIAEVTNGTPGSVQWALTGNYNNYSPYKMSIAPDDSLWLSDQSQIGSGVWKISPDLSTTNLALGPIGQVNGYNAGSHVSEESQPIILFGATTTNMYVVDADYGIPSSSDIGFGAQISGNNRLNSILVYSNIYSTLQTGGWELAPSIWGPCVGLSNWSGETVYLGEIGMCSHGNYLYVAQYRSGVTAGDPAFIQIYSVTNNLQEVWSSRYNGGASDYFFTKATGGSSGAPIDVAVSPDGQYLATMGIDNHLTICDLTNGVPNATTIQTIVPTSFSANGRGVVWDAADNLYSMSSGSALLQQWSLNLGNTYTTYGNSTGTTNFNGASLNSDINVYATNNSTISQNNSYGNPTSGTFTIVRSGGDINSTLTVNFGYTGTASNATYTAGSSGKVVLVPGQTTTNILISAVTDGIPRRTISLTLTVSSSVNYNILMGQATINILNTATPEFIPSVGLSSMYNAFPNDYVSVVLTRLGDLNTTQTLTGTTYTLTGTAVEGTDYTAPSTVTFNPGDVTQTTTINPLNAGQVPTHNPNLPYTGNKTITLKVANGSGYTGGSGSVTLNIIDSAQPAAPVLYSNPLTNSMDATNWNITAANDNMNNFNVDTNVMFGYNIYTAPNYYSQYGYAFNPLPPPPNGASNVLAMTVNKSLNSGGTLGGTTPATAVNVYMTNQMFGGNYAVRFNMNVVEGDCSSFESGQGAYSVEEGPLFGFNHNGTETNLWFPGFQTGAGETSFAADGLFYWISDSGGFYLNSFSPYMGFIGNGSPSTNAGWAYTTTEGSSAFATAFKTNVFTCYASVNLAPYFNGGWTEGGAFPVNGPETTTSPQAPLSEASWADVELKQVGNVESLWIDKTLIMSHTNNTGLFTNGYAMLGYEDPYDGSETPDTAVYYSNLRVVALTPPTFIGTGPYNSPNTKFTFTFTSNDGDLTPSNFTVYGATNLLNGFTSVTGASISQIVNPPGGVDEFLASVPTNGAIRFYRIIQH